MGKVGQHYSYCRYKDQVEQGVRQKKKRKKGKKKKKRARDGTFYGDLKRGRAGQT